MSIMFESGFFDSLQAGGGEDEKAKPAQARLPPRSREEWLMQLERECESWPIKDREAEGPLERGGAPAVIGDLSDIGRDLMQHAPWESTFLDEVEQRLRELESRLHCLGDRFLYRSQKEEGRNKIFLTEVLQPEILDHHRRAVASAGRILDHGEEEERNRKGKEEDGGYVQHAFFPGVSGGIPPPLPKMEPLPVLDQVSKAQGFPASIKKEWRRFFFSEASCFMLQSSFWWVWMECYQSDPEQQANLFTIMADRFVHLVISTTHSLKDELFLHYPRCLAQAIFVVFCKAFPKSVKQFREPSFLQHLCDLTSEWTTGVKSQPQSWKRWPMAALSQSQQASQSEVEQRKSFEFPLRERDILGSEVSHQPQQTGRESSAGYFQEKMPPHLSNQYPPATEEGPSVGPGATFECVQFNVSSRSPLFQHHLSVHKLTAPEQPPGPLMSRTQIRELPPPSITYHKLLHASSALSRERYKEYMREKKRCGRMVNQALTEYHKNRLALERENRELLRHRHEVAIAAEKLMTKYLDASRTGGGFGTSSPQPQ